MNVCSVCLGRPDTTPAGVELTLWKISKELVKLGCDAHIVFNLTASPESPSDSIVDGVHLHGVNASSRNALSTKLSFSLSASQKLAEVGKTYNIDIFAFHGPYSLLSVPLFRRYVSKPFVYHTYATLLYEAQTHLFQILNAKIAPDFMKKLLMYSFYTPLELFSLKYFTKIIVASSMAAREFETYYHYPNNQIGIVPIGQDLFERYAAKVIKEAEYAFEGKKVLLFVGNDWYRKGVWYLILAFNELIRKLPNTILIMTGIPREPYLSLIRNLKLENSVLLVGNVDEETLAKYYALCDVFVLPSFHEGFSNTIIEAMAFGKPVVTTSIAGYPVVSNGKDGFIIKSSNYADIADSIVRLLENNELYQNMSRNAAHKAEEYTWRESARRLLRIYSSLIE